MAVQWCPETRLPQPELRVSRLHIVLVTSNAFAGRAMMISSPSQTHRRTPLVGVAYVALLLVVAIFNTSPRQAAAQEDQWDGHDPIIIVLDGISFWRTLLPGTGLPRHYLQEDLEQHWTNADLLLYSVNWDGDLSDMRGIVDYIEEVKTTIRNITSSSRPDVADRPIVIIGHSWGSVTAYLALRELEAEANRSVEPGAVAHLVTLGSPLPAQAANLGRIVNEHLPNTPTGEEIRTDRLVKPDIVGQWSNVWSRADCISNFVAVADINFERRFFPGDSLCSQFFPDQYLGLLTGAHTRYTTNAATVDLIRLDIINTLACPNVLISGSSVPSGYGAPYNVLSPERELIVEATCNATVVTLDAGSGRPTQYVYRYGHEWTGSAWRQFELSGPAAPNTNDWFIGEASAELTRTPAELMRDNFVVAYVCTWTGIEWKCGCRDSACTQSFWQLQNFRRQ
jgi:hypothetical protein